RNLFFFEHRFQRASQAFIRGYSTSSNHLLDFVFLSCAQRFSSHHFHYTVLETVCYMFWSYFFAALSCVMHVTQDRRFQSTETGFVRTFLPPSSWKCNSLIAGMCQSINRWAAWLRGMQCRGNFIIEIARYIVPRFSD